MRFPVFPFIAFPAFNAFPNFPALGIAFGLLAGGLAGCGDKVYSPEPDPVDEGYFIGNDYAMDEFVFDSSDCAEVFPAGSAGSEAPHPDAAASLRIISTACYHARVRVLDGAGDTVRAFDSRFAIFNRTEAEKNRGVAGYVSWDGKDDAGEAVPGGVYLWRMEFDFGSGRIRRFRTEVLLP